MGSRAKGWVMDAFGRWPDVSMWRMAAACVAWAILRRILREQ